MSEDADSETFTSRCSSCDSQTSVEREGVVAEDRTEEVTSGDAIVMLIFLVVGGWSCVRWYDDDGRRRKGNARGSRVLKYVSDQTLSQWASSEAGARQTTDFQILPPFN